MSLSSFGASASCTTKFAKIATCLWPIMVQKLRISSIARAVLASSSSRPLRFAAAVTTAFATVPSSRSTVIVGAVVATVPSRATVASHENFTGKPCGSE